MGGGSQPDHPHASVSRVSRVSRVGRSDEGLAAERTVRAALLRVRVPSGLILQSLWLRLPDQYAQGVDDRERWQSWMFAEPVLPGEENLPVGLPVTSAAGSARALELLVPAGSPVRWVVYAQGGAASATPDAATGLPALAVAVANSQAFVSNYGDDSQDRIVSFDGAAQEIGARPVWSDPLWFGPYNTYDRDDTAPVLPNG